MNHTVRTKTPEVGVMVGDISTLLTPYRSSSLTRPESYIFDDLDPTWTHRTSVPDREGETVCRNHTPCVGDKRLRRGKYLVPPVPSTRNRV